MTILEESQSIARVLRSQDYLLVSPVSWATYQAFLDEVESEGRHFRHTYDRGRLEVMTRSGEHEVPKELMGSFVVVLAEEMNRPLFMGGALTFDREDVDRGIEPDQCYCIDNEPKVRGNFRIDLRRDPSPDLFIEIEVSRTILDRLEVLAALRVAEVWRYTGKKVLVGLLQPDGAYQWGDRSPSFPGISIGELARFVKMARTNDHVSVIRAFRAWVREQLAPAK